MSDVEVNPENIPEELKDRDQWLLWDRSNDAPRRPHWKGDFYGVSWNDPDDWHGFAEALAAVNKHDSWGLGFVVGRDNDDHAAGLYGCLDLDGCAVDGSPKDWLPDLAPFLDRGAYVEFSPSKHDPDADKHGIRIPIKGFSPPEWWTDVSVPGADHEGVEAEGSKFQTFTGDTLRDAGDEVAEHGEWLEEWLMDAYEAVTGDTAPPRRDDQQDDLTDYERAQEAHDGDGDSAAGGSAEDIMRALDRLDAQRVAEDTIVHTWNDGASTSDGFRAFIPTWAGASCNGTANIVDADKWVDTGGSGRGGPAVMAAIAMGEVDPENAPQRNVEGRLWWEAVEHLRDELGYNLPEAEERGSAPSPAELIARHNDEFDDPAEVPEDILDEMSGATATATDGSGVAVDDASSEGPEIAAALDSDSVFIEAGLDAENGEDISDLNDREKAAAVWEIIRRNTTVHVRVRRDNGSIWSYDDGIWKPEGERALRHAGRQALGAENYGQNVLAELKAQARADPAVELEMGQFGVSDGDAAVENGLLNLRAAADREDDAIRPLKPSDLAMAKFPVRYDPDAEADEWQEFVGEVVEADKIPAIQEYVGYCFHRGGVPIGKALLLVGSGSNGKSTFLNVVKALLGGDNVQNTPLHKFGDDDRVAGLHGKLANIDADLSQGSLSPEGIAQFKRLLGDDPVEGRRLYEEAFQFDPVAKHLYAANQVPDVSGLVADNDDAFWRRWLLVNFPKYIPQGQRDPGLEDRLKDDLPGILNWAVDGWARLRDQGEFTNAEDTDRTRNVWKTWGDSADEFITNACLADEDAENITTREAWKVYKRWCNINGRDSCGQRQFTLKMKEEGPDFGYANPVRTDRHSPRHGYKRLAFTQDLAGELDAVLKEEASEDDHDAGDQNQTTF